MKHTKTLTFLFLVIVTFSSCSKNDNEIDSDVLASIESPYILEALREQNITSKKDVESLTELKLTLNVSKLGDDNCQWRYNYNLHENDLLAGLNQFKSLKKLIIVLRHELNDDKTNFTWELSTTCASIEDTLLPILAQVENLPNLEELYYSSHYRNIASIISLEVKNCPKLKRIGTANPFVGIKDYPNEEIITMDNTNFSEENPSYENFEEYAGSDDDDEAKGIKSLMHNSSIHLEDLPKLESLHLFQAAIRGITKSNCPNLKKVFYFKKRGSIRGTGGWLFEPALTDIEEFYFDYQYYEPFPSYDAVIFDLSSFRNLNTFYYKFFVPGGDRNSVPVGSKLRIQNGSNLQKNLKITIDFRNYLGETFVQGDSRRLAFCLDDDITEEFMANNILIKSRHGDEGSEVVTFSCD